MSYGDPDKRIKKVCAHTMGDEMRTAPIKDPTTLGLVLREARLQSGLTQRELATALDVRQSYIAEMELGKSIKALERLFDFARETGLTLTADIADAAEAD
ncbi:helix-turn-helix domain-containing protein [Clavibacter michiganensis]|uniref:helix-turn-helix domain-containing protein n=1 Tax=Clavibacter michiganensis TaxID=28447 RepID=UPI00215889B6|nr:helix-turn-helix transcriptional regulator [Clavibacter michiganensis]